MTLPIQLGSTSGNPQGYSIQRSLRFRSSASAYLNRTPASASNRKTWTLSAWFKRGTLGVNGQLISTNGTTDATNLSLRFDTDDKLWVGVYNTGSVLATTQVFRDPSAWYHLVWLFDTTQATAANRCRLFINGSEITSFSTDARSTYFALNGDYGINTTQSHAIGRNNFAGSQYFDGYLAEVNFIDGQALTPSSFGYTNSYGVWQPTRYTGTYGTNGFYLPFSDNTSATTLAYDKSGNGNNWTPNNISTTAGATYDSMTDVPTLTSATAANYCVLNPLVNTAGSVSIAQGNLYASVGAADKVALSTIELPNSGKYYFEWTVSSVGAATVVGVFSNIQQYSAGWSGSERSYQASTGNKRTNQTASAYGASFTTNDVIGTAVDMDAGTITFYKNGVSQGVAFSDLIGISWSFGAYINNANGHANFGQRPFSYTPPTGFKALNTFNLPDPVIKKPNQYMDATIWTGDGTTTRSITNSGFQPDLIWDKSRGPAARSNLLVDSSRGFSKTTGLSSDSTVAEGGIDCTTYGGITAVTSNGFTVSSGTTNAAYVNYPSEAYVAWQWKKGATPGFDIVTYTGTGSATTIAHSLGVAPKLIIVKRRNSTSNWPVYDSVDGPTKVMYLNLTNQSTADGGTNWNNTSPTASVFSIGTSTDVNASGGTYVAYLFAEIAGFSKFGSYTGNGSTNGPFVYCGFRPKYVMVKCSSAAENWYVEDGSRDPYNVASKSLEPNLYNAELSSTSYYVDFLSNGFKLRTSDTSWNYNGQTMIYACFAENPFKFANAR